MIRRLLVLAALCLAIPVGAQRGEDLTRYVDPFIGTGGAGHVFPGATMPFGMVQLSPSNDQRGWKWTGGYHYDDTVIRGFAHTHISGAGLSALGDITMMPARTGDTRGGMPGYWSAFSHVREEARPGYYRVHLDTPDADAELTATRRIGFHRYTWRGPRDRFIIVDPTRGILDFTTASGLEVVSATEVRGYKRAFSQSSGNRSVYFVARFSSPFV